MSDTFPQTVWFANSPDLTISCLTLTTAKVDGMRYKTGDSIYVTKNHNEFTMYDFNFSDPDSPFYVNYADAQAHIVDRFKFLRRKSRQVGSDSDPAPNTLTLWIAYKTGIGPLLCRHVFVASGTDRSWWNRQYGDMSYPFHGKDFRTCSLPEGVFRSKAEGLVYMQGFYDEMIARVKAGEHDA